MRQDKSLVGNRRINIAGAGKVREMGLETRGSKLKTIRIAGAGPAGLCAAINLAKAGFSVEVHEREKDVGARWAGSFQCLENYSRKEGILESLEKIGIETTFYRKEFYNVQMLDEKGGKTGLSSKKPLWHVIRRGNGKGMLDYELKRQALDAGVKIKFESVCKNPDIVATGPSSAQGVAREMVFETGMEDCFLLLLDNEIAPKGYAYLLVADGIGTLCVAIMEDFANLEKYFEKARERINNEVEIEIKNPKYKANFVSFYIPSSARKGNAIYAGEAAGFQDFVFGFGMRYAFSSGYLAAKSMIEDKNYDLLWKEEFGKELEIGVLNRAIYEFGGNPAFRTLARQAEKDGDLGRFLYKWARPGFSKRFLTPLAKMLIEKADGCSHPANCSWCPKRRS